ncbi:hypothetical protein K1X84_04040 [bacterium]|nr:hypothetical protein [bacterium]
MPASVKTGRIASSSNSQNQNKEDVFAISWKNIVLILAGFAAIAAYWTIQSPRPYDDDNIGRYFMAQAAMTKPEFFLSIWGRPLAIIFFLLPSQLGYWYCAAATILLSIATCYFTYKAAQASGKPNPWLALIFIAFQPLFFITSYSLCTEPLAAFFLAIGLYYYYKKKWLTSALLLSLMPLGRTELVLILPIFAIVFFREKKYWPILAMGTGLALYQIAGMIATGDVLYLLTASKSFGHGLYQNGPFEHYFQRFIFIVGPVLFVFILLQLVHDIRQRSVNIINISCILIFCTHVYFYWKGNVASIGFLRHFVGVAPMMALWALDGANTWLNDQKNRQTSLIALIGITVITLMYYSFDLIGDYFISPQKDYLKFSMVLLLVLLFVLQHYLNFSGRFFQKLMLISAAIGTMAYTFIKEPPLQLAPEHQTVKNFQVYFEENLKTKSPKTMIAHPWFFFFDDFNYYAKEYAAGNYLEMRKEKMAELPVGGLVVWDTHYSWRLSSNVQQDDLTKNPDYKFVQQFVSPDRKFAIYVFEKTKG